MRKLYCIIGLMLFFIVPQKVYPQDYIPTVGDINRFARTKTVMVLETNPMSEYNLQMEDIVPHEWKITPYGYLAWKGFESKRKDLDLSFLLLNKVTIEKDKSDARYLFMSLLLGSDTKGLSAMPDLCSVPLAYYGAQEETYAYKVGIFLRFIQNHVQAITKEPEIATKNIFLYYNKNIRQLSNKTLYLVADELAKDVNTEAGIKKVYDGPFKLVGREDIQQAIADKDPDVVFLHKVGPGKSRKKNARCYKILVGAADAQFYYFDYHKIDDKSPDGFLVSDFKKISKKN